MHQRRVLAAADVGQTAVSRSGRLSLWNVKDAVKYERASLQARIVTPVVCQWLPLCTRFCGWEDSATAANGCDASRPLLVKPTCTGTRRLDS